MVDRHITDYVLVNLFHMLSLLGGRGRIVMSYSSSFFLQVMVQGASPFTEGISQVCACMCVCVGGWGWQGMCVRQRGSICVCKRDGGNMLSLYTYERPGLLLPPPPF